MQPDQEQKSQSNVTSLREDTVSYGTTESSTHSPQVSQPIQGPANGQLPIVDQPLGKSLRILRLTIVFILFELGVLGVGYVIGHGRVQDVLSLVTSFQLAIVGIIVVVVWVAKRRDKYYLTSSALNRAGKIRIAIGTIATIALVVGWNAVIFPELIRLSLQHDGVDAVATVVGYELVDQGSRGAEYSARSVSTADAINVKLGYDNRATTISIPKGDAQAAYSLTTPPFQSAYSAASILKQYRSFQLDGYTGSLIGTGTAISSTERNYIDLLYAYTEPSNPSPYYVKVSVEDYQGKWGVALVGSSPDLKYLETPDLKLSSS